MKTPPFFLLLLTISSVSYAADDSCSGTYIAVEIKVNSKISDGIVGKLEYAGNNIELVTFTVGGGRAIVLPQVYEVIEKTINSAGVHHIKCRNQNGVVASGTIDCRDKTKPKVTLVLESGQVITNISPEGKKLQREYIPKVDLGF